MQAIIFIFVLVFREFVFITSIQIFEFDYLRSCLLGEVYRRYINLNFLGI